jgi:hypothetical protein
MADCSLQQSELAAYRQLKRLRDRSPALQLLRRSNSTQYSLLQSKTCSLFLLHWAGELFTLRQSL